MSARLPSLRRQLVWAALAVVLATVLLFALVAWLLVVRPAEDAAARQQMRLAAAQAAAPVVALARVVGRIAENGAEWGANGLLSIDDHQRFNQLLLPVINARDQISAVILAREDGREIFLIKTAGGWNNRLSDPAHDGGRQRWLYWDAHSGFSREERQASDYDARTRPWFLGAMQLARDGDLYVTEPYRFYTTQRMGITASTRWTDRRTGLRYALGFDVELRDLTELASAIRLGSEGQVAILTEGGRLLGLPRVPQTRTAPEMNAQLLRSPSEAGLPIVAEAWGRWTGALQPPDTVFEFTQAGQTWFALFDPVPFGQRRFAVMAAAPRSDFAIGQPWHLAAMVGIFVAALALAFGLSTAGAQRLARTLGALAAESERIGALDLDRPVAVTAGTREFAQLAAAQERMRQALLEATRGLEAKVAARTRELVETAAVRQALIDRIANAVFYKDAEARFLGCNRAYEEMFGVQREDIIGKRVLDLEFVEAADRRARQEENERVIAEGSTLSKDIIIAFADGKPHHTLYSVSGFRMPDGSPGGLVGVIVDVEPLHQVQESLRSVTQEQYAIFESATAGIALVRNRVMEQCNGKLEELFGYAPGELLGEPTRILHLDDAAYEAGGASVARDIARGGTHRREQLMRRKDGSRFWCRLSGRAVDPAAPERGSVWMLEDVTDERAAREFLQDQNTFLESEVARRMRQLAVIQDVTIMAMASLAETRDNETGNHIRRTQHYVKALALELRRRGRHAAALDDDTIGVLYKSAPLHDIGKVGIPDRILLKPGKLTPEEFEVMKTHTTLGCDAILAAEKLLDEPNSFLQSAREIAQSHQEKWDGSGYPEGLKGEQIPLSARLMAVADVYDALISRRVYKPPFPHAESVAIIRAGRGAHFDPQIVDAFLAIEGEFQAIAGRYADSEEDLAKAARS
jgi:PAS domain S-box-containing protein